MDPITASSALASGPLGDAIGAASQAAQPTTLIHQGGGAHFAFKLPEQVEVPQVSQAAPTQTYTAATEPTTYTNLARQMVDQVNQVQTTAGEKVRDVLMGRGTTTVNDAMVSVQESTVAFQMLATVRDKLVDSYQQIMSMQI